MTDSFLLLSNIRHCYPESGWELNISRLNISAGHMLGIIGPNGSGKSTLLRIASGILRPNKGQIHLEGNDIFRMNRRQIAQKIGYLPQDQNSIYDVTVREIAESGRYPHLASYSLFQEKDREAVNRSLRITGLEEIGDRRLSRLSGGERKRAFLASILAQEPHLMLLDEPVSALDIHHQARFFRILCQLRDEGIGIAVITHDINLASLFCDSLLLLHRGNSAARGVPQEVIQADILRQVYGEEIIMGKHPQSGRPTILPVIDRKLPHES